MDKIDIIGSSGAGKSTLAHELMGDQQPGPEQENEHPLLSDAPMNQLAHAHPRKTSAGSIGVGRHGDKVPNNQKDLVVGKEGKSELEQKKQESSSLRERLKNCIPNDPNAFLFTLVITAYLTCAVIDFIRTGNASMLETLLPYVSAYVGISRVAPLFPWGKRERNDQ